MELGPGLVVRAVSKGVSIGGCGFTKFLGSLSADSWVCVPAVVFWPEVSQEKCK